MSEHFFSNLNTSCSTIFANSSCRIDLKFSTKISLWWWGMLYLSQRLNSFSCSLDNLIACLSIISCDLRLSSELFCILCWKSSFKYFCTKGFLIENAWISKTLMNSVKKTGKHTFVSRRIGIFQSEKWWIWSVFHWIRSLIRPTNNRAYLFKTRENLTASPQSDRNIEKTLDDFG